MVKKQSRLQEQQDNIEKLVFRYQAGDEQAGVELLKAYGADMETMTLSHYIGKFYRLVRFGKIDFKDYDSRVFMSCFFSGEDQYEIKQSYQYKKTKENVVRRLGHITEAMRVVEDDELKQELCFLFLRQARRYEKTNRTFGGYINNSYRYEVARYIIKLLKLEEPYVRMRKDLLRLTDDRVRDEEADIDIKDSVFVKAPMIFMEEELGNSWVRGLTCGEQFKELSPLQRMIIKLNYYEGWSDGKIADKLGIHINTIFRQRTKANLIVKETVKELKEEGFLS